jgi:transcriptional regulator with XRE-family HTH domain
MNVSNSILSLIDNTPDTVLNGISQRVKARRLELALTQKELATRAGIPLPTYRRFERTGEIALRGLVMLGIALDSVDEFSTLFSSRKYESIDDLLKSGKKKRKRGKRNGSD